MKVLVHSSKERHLKYQPDLPILAQAERLFFPLGTDPAEMLAAAGDAPFFIADAIAPVGRALIEGMPNLKLIHSEGVAFNGIDLEAARERGIFVCNNKGINAIAVAEHAVMLMLMLLRGAVTGHHDVIAGRQIQAKESAILRGFRELGDCRVGLVGFGDIARAAAACLRPFGPEVVYYDVFRRSPEEEAELGVRYAELDELVTGCDIVSLHVPVTPQTEGMVNAQFLAKMKPDALLVNTARGDLVDNTALREALVAGAIGGAAFDTLHPEPTPADHPLVALPPDCKAQVIYSPHIAGVSSATFRRGHRNLWLNIQRVLDGERPVHIVNGL